MWGLLRLPRIGGAIHASDYDNRSRHRQVGLSGARCRCWRAGGHPPPIEAALCPCVLPEASAMLGGHRSLCLFSPLVARAAGAWPYSAPDAAGLREALRQTAEE